MHSYTVLLATLALATISATLAAPSRFSFPPLEPGPVIPASDTTSDTGAFFPPLEPGPVILPKKRFAFPPLEPGPVILPKKKFVFPPLEPGPVILGSGSEPDSATPNTDSENASMVVVRAAEGQKCGMNQHPRAVCGEGLHCEVFSRVLNAGGVCVSDVSADEEGKVCGADSADAYTCASGYSCRPGNFPGHMSSTHQPARCMKDAQADEPCEGSTGRKCAGNMMCARLAANVTSPGKCIARPE